MAARDEVKVRYVLDSKGAVTALDEMGRKIGQVGRVGEESTNRAGQGFSRLARSVITLNQGIALLRVGFQAAERAIDSLITGPLSRIDDITKLSRAIGVSTEQLSGLEVAATLSGTTLETVGRGISVFARNLATAAEGTNLISKAFAELKLDPAQLASQDTVRALADTAKALTAMDAGLRKTNVQQQIFGRGGAQLANFMILMGSAADQVIEKNRELGLTFKEDLGKNAEDLNDQVSLLSLGWEGLKRQVAFALIPTLGPMVDRMQEWVSANRDLLRSGLVDFVRGLSGEMPDATTGMASLGRSLNEIATSLASMLPTINAIAAASNAITAPFRTAGFLSAFRPRNQSEVEQAAGMLGQGGVSPPGNRPRSETVPTTEAEILAHRAAAARAAMLGAGGGIVGVGGAGAPDVSGLDRIKAEAAAEQTRLRSRIALAQSELKIARERGAAETAQLEVARQIDALGAIRIDAQINALHTEQELGQVTDARKIVIAAQIDELTTQRTILENTGGAAARVTREFERQQAALVKSRNVTVDIASSFGDIIKRARDFESPGDFIKGAGQRIADEFESGLIESILKKNEFDLQVSENFSVTLPGFMMTGAEAVKSIWGEAMSDMVDSSGKSTSSIGSLFTGLGDSISGIFRNVFGGGSNATTQLAGAGASVPVLDSFGQVVGFQSSASGVGQSAVGATGAGGAGGSPGLLSGVGPGLTVAAGALGTLQVLRGLLSGRGDQALRGSVLVGGAGLAVSGGIPSLTSSLGLTASPAFGLAGGIIGGLGVIGGGILNATQGGGATTIRPQVGTAIGALGGGLSGAAIGTAIAPGIGTAVGALVGAIVGAVAGSLGNAGPTIGTLVATDLEKKFQEINIPLQKLIRLRGRSGLRAQGFSGFVTEADRQRSIAELGFRGGLVGNAKPFGQAVPDVLLRNAGKGVNELRFDEALGLGSVIFPDRKSDIVGSTNRVVNNFMALGLSKEEALRQLRKIASAYQVTDFGTGLETLQTRFLQQRGAGRSLKDVDFLKASVKGLSDLFNDDLPAGVDMSEIAIRNFSEMAGFDIAKINEETAKAIRLFGDVQNALLGGIGSGIGNLFDPNSTADFATTLRESLRGAIVGGIRDGFTASVKETDLFKSLSASTGQFIADVVNNQLAAAFVVDLPALLTNVDAFLADINPKLDVLSQVVALVDERLRASPSGFAQLGSDVGGDIARLQLQQVAPVDRLGFARGRASDAMSRFAAASTDAERRAALDDARSAGLLLGQEAGSRFAPGSFAGRQATQDAIGILDFVQQNAIDLSTPIKDNTSATEENTKAVKENTLVLQRGDGVGSKFTIDVAPGLSDAEFRTALLAALDEAGVRIKVQEVSVGV